MIAYNEWLIENILFKCNRLLKEVEQSLPELSVKVSSNLPGKLLKHYRKEFDIQSKYGGIRNPAAVLTNKIRHEFTNYDQVRDALTSLKDNLDSCEYYNILIKIVREVGFLVLVLINKIKCSLNTGTCIVDKDKMHLSNDLYVKKQLDELLVQKKLNNCI